MYTVKKSLIIFGIFFLCAAIVPAIIMGADNMKEVKAGGIAISVPQYFPEEEVRGSEKEGAIIFKSLTGNGLLEQFYGVSWGEKPVSYKDLLPSAFYKLEKETPETGAGVEINGHKAAASEVALTIKRPCGRVSGGKLLLLRFYCDKTKRHYLVTQLLEEGVPQADFSGIAKTIKCH